MCLSDPPKQWIQPHADAFKTPTGETIYSATFAVAWNAFVLFWTLTAASLMLSLFSLPFWAAGFMMGKCASI